MKGQDFQDQIEALVNSTTDAMGKIKRLSREQEAERLQFRSEKREIGEQLQACRNVLDATNVDLSNARREIERLSAFANECQDQIVFWKREAIKLGWQEPTPAKS